MEILIIQFAVAAIYCGVVKHLQGAPIWKIILWSFYGLILPVLALISLHKKKTPVVNNQVA